WGTTDLNRERRDLSGDVRRILSPAARPARGGRARVGAIGDGGSGLMMSVRVGLKSEDRGQSKTVTSPLLFLLHRFEFGAHVGFEKIAGRLAGGRGWRGGGRYGGSGSIGWRPIGVRLGQVRFHQQRAVRECALDGP